MDSADALDKLTASEIGRALSEGELEPISLVNEALTRAKRVKEDGIFIAISDDRAKREAEESAKRYAEGQALSPLDGVPLVLKDLIDRKGEITTAGSELYRQAQPAKSDAVIASNLAASGLISVGRVNLSEFAFSGLGLNPHYGTPINPRDLKVPRAPGGSSSGTSVAIASNIVPCGIGTDTGGSVRVPASFNGLVGYKSSSGRIDKTGIFALSRMFDTVGPIGRSVEDCILLDAALRNKIAEPIIPRPLNQLTIFVTQSIVMDEIEQDVARNFEASLLALEAAGANIQHITISEFDEVAALGDQHGSLVAADAYVEHLPLIENSKINLVDRRVTARIMGGQSMKASDVIILQRARERLIDQMKAKYSDGLIAMPTTIMTAPAIEALESDDAHFHKTNMLTLRNTSLGNFLDLPGLALPNGTDRQGMPTSILFNSVSGTDDRLLQYGLSLEKAISDMDAA